MAKIVEQQKKVKRGSKCLKWTSYVLLALAWMTVIGNVWCFLAIDEMVPLFPWKVQGSDTVHYFKLDSYGLSVMCLLKAASAFFVFKQARWTLNAVKPILKEYSDAESGKTQGIKMTERRSKKFVALKKDVKRLTCGVIVFILFCVMYAEHYLVTEANRWIDQYYTVRMNPNVTTPYGQEYIDAGYKSVWDDWSDDDAEEDWPFGDWEPEEIDVYNATDRYNETD